MNLTMAFIFLLAGAPELHAGTVAVSSYGAYPNDGLDDTAAINAAISAAPSGTVILFNAGVYDLLIPRDTTRFIYLGNKTGVTLQGSVTTNDIPETTLLRHVAVENSASPPRLFNVAKGSGITLKNFIVDNTPHLCTSGEITEIDPEGTFVKVQIFDGLPMDDGAACYSANVWDPATRDLKEVESLTYSSSPGNWSVFDATNRIMKFQQSSGLSFLNRIAIGEYMSWHYGCAGESQIRIDSSQNLVLENLLFRNIINMGILVGSTDGITLRKITMRPQGNQLPVGPRDGIHLSRCTGVITAENLDITGVRWDGFVVHAPYGTITEMIEPTRITIAMVVSTVGQTISSGSRLYLLDPLGELHARVVSSATYTQTVDGRSYYNIILTENLPAFADTGTHLKVEDMSPDSVMLADSHFENIAGSSLIMLTDNITVSNTTHRKIMYAAAHIGANLTTGNGGDNIQMLDSVFDTCGWMGKPTGPPGVITIDNLHAIVTNGVVRNVLIKGNLFKNQLFSPDEPTISAYDTDTLTVESNTFENVYCGLTVNAATVSGVAVSGTTVIADNDANSGTYAEISGTFYKSGLKGYNGSTTRYSGSSGAVAEWLFIAPESGVYDVYIYKVVYSNSDTNALISVENDGPTAAGNVNYTVGTNGWHYLGTYSYTGRQAYTISNQRQSGVLRADAVKFIQQ